MMSIMLIRGLWVLAGGLALVLCVGALPLGPVGQSIAAIIVLAGVATAWLRCPGAVMSGGQIHAALPATLPARCVLPVVLTCGDSLDLLFGEAGIRETPHGCYLRLNGGTDLGVLASSLLAMRPEWARQLTVMLFLMPEKHADEEMLQACLHAWQRQTVQLARVAGGRVPMVVCCHFNGPESPWFISYAKGTCAVAAKRETTAAPMADWLHADKTSRVDAMEPHMRWAGAINAATALAWLRGRINGGGLVKVHQPDNNLLALVVRFAPLETVTGNAWQRHITTRTTLRCASTAAAPGAMLPFPDVLLPGLPVMPGAGMRQRATTWAMGLTISFGVLCLAAAAWNNQYLITRIAADLQRYHSLSPTRSGARAAAMEVLRADAAELEYFHRQGAPLRLGLGFYCGERLYRALLNAIDGYLPPPPVKIVAQATPPTPQAVHLDSLSLFATGSAHLKTQANPVLMAALGNIQARQDWLIVINGHTDATGNPRQNLVLSQARAQAVCDWLRERGNIPAGCFRVQGLGASRPLANNDTAAGRAANRRVDIQLLPEPGACRPEPSSANATTSPMTAKFHK